MQKPILFSHSGLLAQGHVVETHRDLDDHPIQCQEHIQHLPRIALAGDRLTQISSFPSMLWCHWDSLSVVAGRCEEEAEDTVDAGWQNEKLKEVIGRIRKVDGVRK